MVVTGNHPWRRFEHVKLYVLLTESLCAGPWEETARQAIDGGADCIQLREKTLPDHELLDRARRLAALCRDAGILFFVNDRPDIARLADADGVHLGQDDLPLPEARQIVGTKLLIGVSTHTIEQARAVMELNPDYLAVGPMFATETKPQRTIAGPALLRRVMAETSMPLMPIGGINEHTIDQVLATGLKRVCVCSAVISRRDVAAAARSLKRRLDEAVDRSEDVQEAPGVTRDESH